MPFLSLAGGATNAAVPTISEKPQTCNYSYFVSQILSWLFEIEDAKDVSVSHICTAHPKGKKKRKSREKHADMITKCIQFPT